VLSEKRNKFKDHKTRLGANEEKTELIMKKLLRKTSSAGLKLWKWNTVKIEDPRSNYIKVQWIHFGKLGDACQDSRRTSHAGDLHNYIMITYSKNAQNS